MLRVVVLATLALASVSLPAAAQMPRVPESEIDPITFKIDEFKYLGVKPDASLSLVDQNGQNFTLKDKEGVPLILVLSYFGCDGTCSVVNADLAQLLSGQSAWQVGRDFRVLTVSFDPHDTQQTLKDFKDRLALPAAWEQGWTLSLPTLPEQAKRLADSVGFKYFWSSQDRTFFHPGVYIFLSPEGRVVRYLYSTQTKSFDVGLALTDAMGDRIAPHDILNYAVGLCYSYNYKDGRYKLNIPAFVGGASLLFGITVFVVSVFVYRRRDKGEGK
jgi:protein SCO1/2